MSTGSTSFSTYCYRFYYRRVTPNPLNPDLQGAPTFCYHKQIG